MHITYIPKITFHNPNTKIKKVLYFEDFFNAGFFKETQLHKEKYFLEQERVLQQNNGTYRIADHQYEKNLIPESQTKTLKKNSFHTLYRSEDENDWGIWSITYYLKKPSQYQKSEEIELFLSNEGDWYSIKDEVLSIHSNSEELIPIQTTLQESIQKAKEKASSSYSQNVTLFKQKATEIERLKKELAECLDDFGPESQSQKLN